MTPGDHLDKALLEMGYQGLLRSFSSAKHNISVNWHFTASLGYLFQSCTIVSVETFSSKAKDGYELFKH